MNPGSDLFKLNKKQKTKTLSKQMLELLNIPTKDVEVFLGNEKAFEPALECLSLIGVS